MGSVGLDLRPWVENDLLVHEAWRPSQYGIEMHLLRIHKLIEVVKPQHVIIDPIRKILPTTGMVDLSPMAALILLIVASQLVTRVSQPL